MDINECILAKLATQDHLEKALRDLARVMGHTKATPLSTSLFCLDFDLGIEEHDQIMCYLSRIAEKRQVRSLFAVKAELNTLVPKTKNFSEPTFKAMLKIFIKQFELKLHILGLE